MCSFPVSTSRMGVANLERRPREERTAKDPRIGYINNNNNNFIYTPDYINYNNNNNHSKTSFGSVHRQQCNTMNK